MVLLGQTLAILGTNHWITISTVGGPCTCDIFPGDAKKQTASFLMMEEKAITIEYANNQVSNHEVNTSLL